jgi:GNAT superfamily N-acetyltransferase
VSEPSASSREIRELAVGETRLAHDAMRALRPAQADAAEFAQQVDEVLRVRGYRLIAAFVPGREQAVAAAGFRVACSLAWGHHVYVDDLSTVPDARRQGHASALLEWLQDEARCLGCEQLHLDSGTGAERAAAHRLYHAHGYFISSHHFARGA